VQLEFTCSPSLNGSHSLKFIMAAHYLISKGECCIERGFSPQNGDRHLLWLEYETDGAGTLQGHNDEELADQFKKMPCEVATVLTGMIRGARPRGRKDFSPYEKGRRAEK